MIVGEVVTKLTADVTEHTAGFQQAIQNNNNYAKSVEQQRAVLGGMQDELNRAIKQVGGLGDINAIAARSYAILRGETEKATTSYQNMRGAIAPLAIAATQLTGLFKDQSPVMAAVSTAIDGAVQNLVVAAIATGSWAGALALLTGPVGIVTGLVIAATAAIVGFVAASKDAKKQADELLKIQKQTELFAGVTPAQRAAIQHLQNRRDIIRDVSDVEKRNALLRAEGVRAGAEQDHIAAVEADRLAKSKASELQSTREGLDRQIDMLRKNVIAYTEGKEAAEDFDFQQDIIRKHGVEGLEIFKAQRVAHRTLTATIEDRIQTEKRHAEMLKEIQAQTDLETKLDKELENQVKSTTATMRSQATSDFEDMLKRNAALESERKVRNSLIDQINQLNVSAMPEGRGKEQAEITLHFEQQRNALNELINQYGHLDPVVQKAREALESLDRAQAAALDKVSPLARSVDAIFSGISSAWESSVQGIIQGTITVGEAFKKMGQSIVLSMSRMFMDLALQEAKSSFMQNIFPLLKQGLGALIGGAFGGTEMPEQLGGPGAPGFENLAAANTMEATTPLTNVTINGSVIPNAGVSPDQVISIVHEDLDNRGITLQTVENRMRR